MNGLKTWRVVRCCRKCGNPVKRENRKLRYPWVCLECNENMYSFETYHARRVFRKARGHR